MEFTFRRLCYRLEIIYFRYIGRFLLQLSIKLVVYRDDRVYYRRKRAISKLRGRLLRVRVAYLRHREEKLKE